MEVDFREEFIGSRDISVQLEFDDLHFNMHRLFFVRNSLFYPFYPYQYDLLNKII